MQRCLTGTWPQKPTDQRMRNDKSGFPKKENSNTQLLEGLLVKVEFILVESIIGIRQERDPGFKAVNC